MQHKGLGVLARQLFIVCEMRHRFSIVRDADARRCRPRSYLPLIREITTTRTKERLSLCSIGTQREVGLGQVQRVAVGMVVVVRGLLFRGRVPSFLLLRSRTPAGNNC